MLRSVISAVRACLALALLAIMAVPGFAEASSAATHKYYYEAPLQVAAVPHGVVAGPRSSVHLL